MLIQEFRRIHNQKNLIFNSNSKKQQKTAICEEPEHLQTNPIVFSSQNYATWPQNTTIFFEIISLSSPPSPFSTTFSTTIYSHFLLFLFIICHFFETWRERPWTFQMYLWMYASPFHLFLRSPNKFKNLAKWERVGSCPYHCPPIFGMTRRDGDVSYKEKEEKNGTPFFWVRASIWTAPQPYFQK